MKRRSALFGGLCLSLIIIITTYTRDWENVEFFGDYNINNLNKHKTQACVHPDLSMLNDFDLKSITNEYATCGDAEKEWIYTKNGKFYISPLAVKRHGAINCTYTPIQNIKDKYESLNPVHPMLNESKLITDAFKVSCKSASGGKYDNYHACISIKTQSNATQGEMEMSNTDKSNVMILGLDSFSRLMFQRLLPKTHEYLTKILDGSVLEGYNIVGDGTTRNLMPMFTGKHLYEVPEVQRGFPGAKNIDEVLEFIWKKYENQSYVTQFAEDYPLAGAFFYRTRGFSKQPVTHYMRPYYLAFMEMRRNNLCIGERSTYKVYLDWLREGLETNKRKPFFIFGFSSWYSHDGYRQMPKIEEYNIDFLKYITKNKILENTFLILMGDHGRRYGEFRMTEQGKLEERQPYFGIFVPPNFRRKFPKKYQTFVENTKRLVTPLDIHETLLDIIGEKGENTNSNITSYSLFTPIPLERTCADAGIESHWCACLKSEPISVSDPRVIRCVQHAVSHINEKLKTFFTLCHQLSLKNILKASSFKTDSNVLSFKSMSNGIADLSDELNGDLVHYQITFETDPSAAMFEVSFVMHMKTWDIKLHGDAISRINMYGDAPKCIEKSRPDLRPYCYCRL